MNPVRCRCLLRGAGAAISAVLALSPAWTIAQAASFSGHVADKAGNPLGNMVIKAGHIAGSGSGPMFIVDGQASTDQFGNYAIADLGSVNRQYEILLDTPGYVRLMYPDALCVNPVCFGQTYVAPQTGLDFVAAVSSSIYGTVHRADNNAPVAATNVDLFLDGQIAGSRLTGADGSYVFGQLPAGNYALEIQPDGVLLGQDYALRDFDAFVYFGSDTIVLAEGQAASNIDFNLQVGGVISGSVLSAINGAPVNAYLYLEKLAPPPQLAYQARDTVTGAYSFGPLLPGTYRVEFAQNDDYIPQYYPGAASDAGAQDIILTYGQAAAGIDAHLVPTRSIAGTVKNASGQPLSGVAVHVLQYNTLCPMGCFLFDISDAVTDGSGHFLMQGLRSSSSPVYYLSADDVPGYEYAFYPSVTPCCFNIDPIQVGATALALGDAENKTNIDIVLQAGATISGRAYDVDTGSPVASGGVFLYDANWSFVAQAQTDAAGNYALQPERPGNYYLRMDPVQSFAFFYPDYTCYFPCDINSVPTVNLALPQAYPNMDFAMHVEVIFRGNFE